MDATARRTGRAFMVSGMTAIAGVATLGLSSMPLLSDFGIIVAINMTVALFSALVVLPPILVWADQRNWVYARPDQDAVTPVRDIDERYPPVDQSGVGSVVESGVGSGVGGLNGQSNGDQPVPAPVEPQPVSPGRHAPPRRVPSAVAATVRRHQPQLSP